MSVNFKTIVHSAARLGCVLLLTSSAPVLCSAQQQGALAESNRAIYRGEFDRAAALAEAYMKTHPNSAQARVLLARAKLAQGKFQEAFDDLGRAVDADPTNVDALYYIGTLSAVLAQVEYEQLYALAPDSVRVHQLLAESYRVQGKLREAESEYLAALKSNPQSAEVLTALGELNRTQGRIAEAIECYSRAEQAGGLNYVIAYGLGACYSGQQQHERAVEYLRRAVTTDPDAAAARFALGLSLSQVGQIEEAIAELKAAIRREPKMRQAYFLLGRLYQKTGQREAAQASLRKAEELAKQEVAEDQGLRESTRPEKATTKSTPAGPAPKPRP